MKIKPFDATIRALLESGFYRIPRFQRPYSWEQENVNDFWQDTVVAEDEDYFIGSFVVYKDRSQEDLSFIVDGQQRLTTITLLFAALRDTMLILGLEDLARGIHKLIERADINNEEQYVLQSETPYPFLQEYIQKLGDPELPEEVGAEEFALKRAYQLLLGKLSSELSSIELSARITDEKKMEKKRDALLQIRDKLLRLKLIVVELDNDDDAYLIFETLNTRGKDLTVADLVKNHLTRLLRPKNKGVDIAKDKWLGIQQRFDEASVDISINSFLLHSWLSRYPYTSQKKLFKEIKQKVRKANASQFLDDLVNDSILYRRLVEPSAFSWDKQDREIRDAIISLNMFRVAQPLPMMLALLRVYENGEITKRQASLAFKTMEGFHVQFTAITAQRTGGGTAQMYSSSARQLSEAADKDKRMEVIREFIEKMRQRIPSYEEFEANFRELYFASTNTRDRALIRYLLRHFDQYWREDDVAIDYDKLTIEHIAPESHREHWSGVTDSRVGMVGNLVLISEELNNELANKSFEYKLRRLKDARVPLDSSLATAASWDDKAIEARTRELARIAYNEVFAM